MRVCYCLCRCVCALLCVCIFLACMINQFGTFRWASEREREREARQQYGKARGHYTQRQSNRGTDRQRERTERQTKRKRKPTKSTTKRRARQTKSLWNTCAYVCICVCMYVHVCKYVCMYVCMYSIIQSECNWVCMNVGCVQCIIYASLNSQKSPSPSLSFSLSDVKTALKLTSALLFALWHLFVVVVPFTLTLHPHSPFLTSSLSLSFPLFTSDCSLRRRRLWQI